MPLAGLFKEREFVKEQHGLSGRLHIVVTDLSGRVIEERRVNNLITSGGRELLARLFAGLSEISDLHIAVGNNGEGLPAQQAVLQQVDIAKATTTYQGVNAEGNALLTVSAELPALDAGVTQQLQEAGIVLSEGEQQTLYNRVTFPVINRSGNVVMNLSWEVKF